jgi:hypothetical protein
MKKKGDDKFRLVKRLVEAGDFTTIEEVVNFVKITHLARESHIAYSTLLDRALRPELFKLEDFINIGKVLDLSPVQLTVLALTSIEAKPKPKPKPKAKPKK